MCGIAGILLKPHSQLPDLRERLDAMAHAMCHRGPDDHGVYVSPDARVALANTRLAIRDLSPAGHMPMGNAAGNIWITYNGEIYNTGELRPDLERLGYVFVSQSDTEVILHGYEAWGQEVVKRLHGMFAFGILDLRQGGTLFLARDHMGIKPLYYAWAGDGFLFASELKALLASGLVSREISAAGLAGYLAMGSVPNPLTIYSAVSALEPSSRLTLSVEQPEPARPDAYWRLPDETAAPCTYAQAVARVRALLAQAVSMRLVSDVPLGAFLSGGLDSSTVVALMRHATGGTIRTCSMVFEEAGYSEAPYARAVAQAVGADHYERVVTADDVVNEFDRILWAMDQPTVDGVNTYFVSQTARQAGLTVALSGVGGDELFGGYPNTFRGAPRLRQGIEALQAIPGASSVARGAIALLPNRARWAKVHDALARPASPASAYLARRGLFSPGEIRRLLRTDLLGAAGFDPVQHIAERVDGDASRRAVPYPLTWTSRAELRTYMHHQLLRDTDVMSMAHSLEVRVPLVDTNLVETVLRLPDALKTRRGSMPKALLADAVGDLLPPIVRARRDKQTFTFPFELWMRGKLHDRVESALDAVKDWGCLQPAAVDAVSRDYALGRVHWSRPWALVALRSIL